MAVAELRQSMDKLDSYAKNLILMKLIKLFKEELGDRGPLLELILDDRRCEHFVIGKDAPHLAIYFIDVNGFVEVVDCIVE